MNNYQHPKLTNIITLVVIAIVFGFVIWNVWSSYEESIKEYNFPGVKILKPITITAYQYYDNGTDVLVYNQTKPTYIDTTFITTSFSALNPITVKQTMEIRNINDTQWEGI
ncbi:MAG: hypothetical protein IIA83_08930, partial [Thaumarchaeota archaeon]|nr:hypothetical protein [Nitrososphaerota archaeon]